MDELETVCRQAAAQLAEREGDQGALPAAVVLPLAGATRVVRLPELPESDGGRFALLSRFAEDEMRPANASCYGFVAEAVTAGGDDVVVVVYGARGHHPRITAALHGPGGGLGEWATAEDLAPAAMPFLAPLQHAADAARPPDVMADQRPIQRGP